MQKIGLIDLGHGNIGSIFKAFEGLKVVCEVITKEEQLKYIDKIIIPGVGHFSVAVKTLKDSQLIEPLKYHLNYLKKPMLGICLGMQLMADWSDEGKEEGLSLIPGKVVKIKINNKKEYKIPNIGWNKVKIINEHKILKNITIYDEFYFLHSYHYICNEEKWVSAKSRFEFDVNSIISYENLIGVQFHPEKSHQSGLKILSNFITEI
jgi:glutamine amidotransferase